MYTIAISNTRSERVAYAQSASLTKWIQKVVTVSEANRFGVSAALILVQVSVAGFGVVIP